MLDGGRGATASAQDITLTVCVKMLLNGVIKKGGRIKCGNTRLDPLSRVKKPLC